MLPSRLQKEMSSLIGIASAGKMGSKVCGTAGLLE